MPKIWDQIDVILKDLNSIKETFETELPKRAENDLVYAHKSIIASYYAQYPNPNTYRRKANGQNLMSTLFYKKTKKGSTKIKIGSEGMGSHGRKGYPDINEDNVFDLMWNSGIRGLPKMGDTPLTHDVDWMGNHFNAGEHWINPKWSGEGEPWRNKYKARLFGVPAGTPDEVMAGYMDRWPELDGEDHADEVADIIRSTI